MIKDYWLNDNMVVTRYWGVVTGTELNGTALGKSGDRRLDDVKFIIGDWYDCEHPKLSMNDINELIAYLTPISRICPSAKSGTIVKPDETGNALASYYKMLCEEHLMWEVEVFHSLEDCYEWFGIPYTPPPYKA